jgi:hypothetical protein
MTTRSKKRKVRVRTMTDLFIQSFGKEDFDNDYHSF